MANDNLTQDERKDYIRAFDEFIYTLRATGVELKDELFNARMKREYPYSSFAGFIEYVQSLPHSEREVEFDGMIDFFYRQAFLAAQAAQAKGEHLRPAVYYFLADMWEESRREYASFSGLGKILADEYGTSAKENPVLRHKIADLIYRTAN